ncbi:MAG: Ig-like domain-containing protein, partial [Firmicutes bacterium]|nr:Ig-like domain-containing protein [Bacillota bacterium]
VGVKNKYENYCNNILQQDSGVNARLQAMYLTHGFEGEIKKDIENFCDGMVAQAGLYGQFALTCAGQSDLQSVADIQKIQKQFADTVLSLADKKAQAITGHDNYCYVTNTVMGQDQVRATSSITATTESVGSGFALRGHESTDWDVTVPSILDDVYSQVLYHQYQSLNQGAHSFPEYLNKYGAFNDKDYTGTIMTKYVGAETFPLSDGVEMKASSYFAGESYFSSGGKYRIDVGTGSKVEWDYYYVHDRVMVDLMDMGTGEIKVNQMAGARAFYGEAHGRWITDEPWMFYTEGIYEGTSTSYNGGKTISKARFAIQLPVLKLTPVHDLNGDDDSGNPFFAFDRTMFIDGISNHIGPIIQNERTHITSVKLSKTKFKYTGKAIKPKLTVKAGKKVVPAKYYTVKYLDNKAVGLGKVIVKGKGQYSGIHSKHFKITSKSGKALTPNTEAKMVAKGKKSMRISWPAIKKADGYDIFFARCNHDGTKTKYKKVKTIKNHKKVSYTKTGLKSGVSYKAKVKAFVKKKGKKKYIMTSPTMHAYAGGGTKHFTNAKSVKVKKTKITLKKGKTYKIKASVKKLKRGKKLMPASHMKKLRYMSMNKKIATVTKAGKIKAKTKGKCIIYVYAHNGVGKLVHVTVK